MARRTRMSQQKRQRELRKAEKAAQKRAKRHGLVVEEDSVEEADGEPAPIDDEETGEVTSVEQDDGEFAAAPAHEDLIGPVEDPPEQPAPVTPDAEMTSSQEHPEKVDAYCKVCKSMTSHSVTERTKTNKPKRVQCETCQDAHVFRAKAPVPRKKAAKSKAAPAEASYDSMIAGRDLSESLKYEMSREFAESGLVDHDSFGGGLVVRVLRDQKIEVRFPEGTKTLAHAR